DVLFLAEAFTRPAMMHALAAIGFHQSYTYFTWRNTAAELTAYMADLRAAAPHMPANFFRYTPGILRHYPQDPPAAAPSMRPNFFVNTPDILSQYLQHAGPAAFRVRAVLASMLTPSWGV